ncbi:family 2 encapsulin nanocompartment cargo protein polyprenyl transferase [Prauserella cavernicola]|uniref:Polyprenyl synthetase family protein n=1 Tax=Prauserella cavernicola TaxID=2800127 RepID=A0A934QM50_9PSEU|nr:family 2 encapsulin nanocompartment cargo protein polyprenyl transferase [Prauserella cavernicola]MBK1782841.1 polyprenyl synthetase family protein [Prauserella cavernicola]
MATPTAVHIRTTTEILTDTRSTVDPELRDAVNTLPPPMRHLGGYHLGWWDEHGTEASAPAGKALRPALVLLAAEAVGGRAGRALPSAVAVELVHNFSLLHDDVMDGDVTRRHRATAWSVFGASPAVLAGNSLLALAYEVLVAGGAGSEAARTLGAAVQDLMAGQHADLDFEDRTDVTLPECARMAEQKTGALLGCACALGALAGGAPAEQVSLVGRFGQRLGLAFQIVDDLLGIWGTEAVTGKPAYSDLRNRKKSLPVVAALTSGTAAGGELARLYAGSDPIEGDDLVRAAELIAAAGGRGWCQARADALLDQAWRDLTTAGVVPRATAELGALARLVTQRDH